jgi:toxin ParE1/3/4
MRLLISQAARADIDEIWVHTATEWSIEAANRFRESLSRIFSLLRRNPFAGRSRDELSSGLRSLPVGKYLVFYRVESDAVRVVRVIHGMQDLPARFRQ